MEEEELRRDSPKKNGAQTPLAKSQSQKSVKKEQPSKKKAPAKK